MEGLEKLDVVGDISPALEATEDFVNCVDGVRGQSVSQDGSRKMSKAKQLQESSSAAMGKLKSTGVWGLLSGEQEVGPLGLAWADNFGVLGLGGTGLRHGKRSRARSTNDLAAHGKECANNSANAAANSAFKKGHNRSRSDVNYRPSALTDNGLPAVDCNTLKNMILNQQQEGEHELRNAHSEELMGIRREEEMEMSDEDADAEELTCKRIRIEQNGVQSQASLREENDSLRWQLDAYRNEVDLLRRESRPRGPEEEHGLTQGLNHVLNHGLISNQGLNNAEVQIQQLQQSMHHLQQQLLGLQEQLRSREDELEQAREEQRALEGEVHCLTDKLLNNNGEAVEITNTELQEKVVNGCVPSLYPSRERRGDGSKRGGIGSEREALLLGVMCTFLHVHPFGANLEYLWSYMQRLDNKVTAAELERLMLRLPAMFRQELSGVGANLEKRWKFCGFDTLGTP